jgi:hypothetical protein
MPVAIETSGAGAFHQHPATSIRPLGSGHWHLF